MKHAGKEKLVSNNAVAIMVMREFNRVRNEPSRVAGMLLQPLVFLLVFGQGLHQSFSWQAQSDISYGAFFYPGILGLVVLFSAIYATLTLVDDKKCGLFRMVLVSPAGLRGALIGKVAATAALGFGQSLLFLPLIYLLGIKASITTLAFMSLLLALGSWCFALLGVLLAWISPSASAFHALMSILLIPMWLLSGAMFPLDAAIFRVAAWLNPMAYLVDGLRACLLGTGPWLFNIFALIIFSLFFGFSLGALVKKRPIV